MTRIRLTILCLLFFPSLLRAQSAEVPRIATDRLLWHENVDNQQKKLLNAAGEVAVTADPTINLHIHDALIKRVDQLQLQFEADSSLSNNNKKRCLRNLEFVLKGYLSSYKKPDFSPAQAPQLMRSFEECLRLDLANESILPVVQQNEYGVGMVLVDCFIFPTENSGLAASRLELLRKYCHLHPEEILPVLNENPSAFFADSLIRIAAYRDIPRLYDYAQSRNELGARIRKHPDSLVRLIASMANSKSGRLYYPFLENLLRGKITLAEIDRVKEDDLAYFRLLVQTRIEYASRLLPPHNDTAREMKALTAMITRKAKESFVHDINALHSENNESVRFKKLDGLTPQELYYLAVMTEDQVYTSSFVRGIYPRIFQRMSQPRSDSLLISVQGDYFRKFIKICAAYNTLNDFLGRMEKENASVLMKAFVFGLEKTETMEEAVDVADSYSSIREKDPVLAGFIKKEVKWNYDRASAIGSQRGISIYHILSELFASADQPTQKDLSSRLGIPPVYAVNYSSLKDEKGRIGIQVFFYGDEDKDGQRSFSSFMNTFKNNTLWKVTENDEWVSITTRKQGPVQIYANKPLYGEDDPEEKAIDHLSQYLSENRISPSIYVHRGHSYHVKSTMERIQPSAKIVLLGSCGGYNNIKEILGVSEDAHIISSKQTGTMNVNEPIIQSILQTVTAEKDVNWINLWKDLSTRFQSGDAREKFDDYIPPYKNLGAIFIKAYNRSQLSSGNQIP